MHSKADLFLLGKYDSGEDDNAIENGFSWQKYASSEHVVVGSGVYEIDGGRFGIVVWFMFACYLRALLIRLSVSCSSLVPNPPLPPPQRPSGDPTTF